MVSDLHVRPSWGRGSARLSGQERAAQEHRLLPEPLRLSRGRVEHREGGCTGRTFQPLSVAKVCAVICVGGVILCCFSALALLALLSLCCEMHLACVPSLHHARVPSMHVSDPCTCPIPACVPSLHVSHLRRHVSHPCMCPTSACVPPLHVTTPACDPSLHLSHLCMCPMPAFVPCLHVSHPCMCPIPACVPSLQLSHLWMCPLLTLAWHIHRLNDGLVDELHVRLSVSGWLDDCVFVPLLL